MTTEIYIISGFLGAGKTTLIQKLIKESFQKDKVVLIENDFGEISIDAALLKSSGIEVKEINPGCICCSLSGDFVKAIKELLDRFHPDKIIIEPSGVGKLSDIMKACSDQRIQQLAKVKSKITIVDVKRCKVYLHNFGEFFEDQIQNADVVLLSHTENFPDKIRDAYNLIKSLNPNSTILSKPWNQIGATEILYSEHEHKKNVHHNHFGCEHNHWAEEFFDTVTIHTKKIFRIDDLEARILDMEKNAKGTILRAKGILRSTEGYVNVQYLPGDIRITNCTTSGEMLCIIGQNLNQQELHNLFSEE